MASYDRKRSRATVKKRSKTRKKDAEFDRRSRAARKGWRTRKRAESLTRERRERAAKKRAAKRPKPPTKPAKAKKKLRASTATTVLGRGMRGKAPSAPTRKPPSAKPPPVTATPKKPPRTPSSVLAAGIKGTPPKTTKRKPARPKKVVPTGSPRTGPLGPDELADLWRERYERLRRIAKGTGQIKAPPEDEPIDSLDNVGEKVVVPIDLELRPESVEEIVYRIDRATAAMGGRNLWLAVMVLSGIGEKLIGYGQRVLRSEDPMAERFQTEAVDSTGIYRSREGMLDKLRSLLDRWASDIHTIVHVEYVTIMNYERRKQTA